MIVDIETDGLLDTITKIHVVSYCPPNGGEVKSIFDYDEMREFFSSLKYVIGHNYIRYDKRAIEKVLGIKLECKIYDTLPMSWVMFPQLPKHGLEDHGERYGIPKPEIEDWENLTTEEYAHRCEEDVKINQKLWADLKKRFMMLYEGDKKSLNEYLMYLSQKMETAAKAEDNGWCVDVPLVEASLEKILTEQEKKLEQLKQFMPKVPKYSKRKKPAQMFNKDRSLSKRGKDWYALLDSQGLPHDYEDQVQILKSYEDPNPNSTDQVKAWLTSLGWEPCSFDYKKNDEGTERQIPQIRVEGEDGKELAPSVKILIEEYPEVEILDGLTILQHRKSIFEGILDNLEHHEDGTPFVRANIGGLTNTLRFKHKSPLVNLPGVDKPWGKEIRGCLIAPEGYTTCGADMVSLESTTKKHFIYPYDPDYVAEMSVEGFDEHLDLAVKAGDISSEDYHEYIYGEMLPDKKKQIKSIRTQFKPINYSAVYGVGVPKLVRSTGMTSSKAGRLLHAYWERNWAVKAFAEDQEVKTLDGQMWVKNTVNGFWYTLRYKKDIFSTVNQGTGAYCFDQWVFTYLGERESIVGQFHDEVGGYVKIGEEKLHSQVLKGAIKKVNERLKLNVLLDIDIKYGKRYSDVH